MAQYLKYDVSTILADPTLAKGCADRYALVNLTREYISLFDNTTKTIYLYYLLGKDSIETSRLLGTTYEQAMYAKHNLINGFNKYATKRLNNSEYIDIKKTEKYVDCMQLSAKMDDDQIAEAFNEDMLTTKIMKHFVRRSGIANRLFYGSFASRYLEFDNIRSVL